MKILFTYENPLPNDQADAEVFVTTAKYLAVRVARASLHVPVPSATARAAAATLAQMPIVRAWAPARPAALRHLVCGLTLPWRREFRAADLIYTRNLWVAALSILFGRRVVFDHYRPWPDQLPPLAPLIYRLCCHPRFLAHVCHSEYTRSRYLALGVPAAKLFCVHNGFEPDRLRCRLPIETAKARIGIAPERRTAVYTGRINRRKGLEVVIEAARRAPDHEFLLVGSSGDRMIEALARDLPNVRIVPWQSAAALATYLDAADVLLIPPSRRPLAAFGSTVLPLKVFLYLASGRPIVAGDLPDLREVLRHGENALLCRPDDPEELAASIRRLTSNAPLAQRLGATAAADSEAYTWDARARRIIAIVRERLESAPPAPDPRPPGHRRAWLAETWRWLVHLARERSWALPPRDPSDRDAPRAVDG